MKKIVVLMSVLLIVISVNCFGQEKIPASEKKVIIELRDQIVQDLNGNLLPFWKKYSVDPNDPNQGFYGGIAMDGTGKADAKKHNVLFARYLWTYSSAYRIFKDEESLKLAHRAYNYLSNYFWDKKNGGVFWELNADGSVSDSSKMSYGLSFAMYAFSEYYKITKNEESLEKAKTIFRLMEKYGFDKENGGYMEAFKADWTFVSGKGMAGRQAKSMNTHLHILEAYTNLYRVWPDAQLKQQMYGLIDMFWKHILNTNTHHQELYFAKDWTVNGEYDSYGHDIEFSWLFDEAGKVLGDKALIKKIEDESVKIAATQLAEGMNSEGAMIYEKEGANNYRKNISWWVQAEAIVGFLNAYEISGDKKFLDGATGVWNYIKAHMIDKQYGGWIPDLTPEGLPKANSIKADGWTCPYHNSRMGFEVYERFHSLK